MKRRRNPSISHHTILFRRKIWDASIAAWFSQVLPGSLGTQWQCRKLDLYLQIDLYFLLQRDPQPSGICRKIFKMKNDETGVQKKCNSFLKRHTLFPALYLTCFLSWCCWRGLGNWRSLQVLAKLSGGCFKMKGCFSHFLTDYGQRDLKIAKPWEGSPALPRSMSWIESFNIPLFVVIILQPAFTKSYTALWNPIHWCKEKSD